MSNQPRSPSRRGFLRQSLAIAPAVGLLGTSAFAPTQHATAAAQPSAYAPRYFTAPEWEFLQAAVDRLIPANEDGPGALEAGVPEFIDREMEAAYGHGGFWYMQGPFVPDTPSTLGYQLRFTPRDLYRTAIAAIDDWCRKQHDKDFPALAPEVRDEVLHQLEKGGITLEQVPAATFFAQLLQNTKEGYFADPMYGGNRQMGGWKMIGFPGARADYADWIEQPGKVYPLGPVSIRGERQS
ncbi:MULTISPECIES: gluconate 2-dehydrogenase subunit 3 family protein [Rhodanobacter]|uniref:gluconate 2-dehydrogenase subunit 3 family protein n=1 Tax=Rhodanobacter TaxID=75309 RepID=UPI00040C1EE1|nr:MULTISPECIES: gluconate 2-dehydrogenase subunit 3 family protein [Rhodanobacter]TAN16839.1 MAG: gluconate 2-dehydrogenase subunit 3 family protein [Rhodanobacter sp.]UJJ54348.1 gluconate 2-dehydrogenase subunit 3 family protein [Rhodanobacter thiooxydans]